MLLSTGIGLGAEAAGIGLLTVAARERRTWPRRHLTIAGAVLCLLVGPGACVGGFVDRLDKLNHADPT